MTPGRTCLCPDCDLTQVLPDIPPGAAARCRACGTTLGTAWPGALRFALAASVVGLLLLLVALSTDLAVVERAGRRNAAALLSGPATLAEQGFWPLTVLVGFVAVVAPLVTTAFLLLTLLGVRAGWPRQWLIAAFAWRNRLRPWSMIEVFLIGYFVAYTKLLPLVQIDTGPALFALILFMLTTVATDAALDREAVWSAIAPDIAHADDPAFCCETCHLACAPAARCPRCNARLRHRKPDSVTRAAALSLSALILYVPANTFPVLTIEQLGRGGPSTILGTVWELAGTGDVLLAVIVFLASITVPVLKILGLAAMLAVVVGLVPTHQQRRLTLLYRIVAAIGRWSMIDIFMEAILSSLVKFGAIASVRCGPGALAFAAVVILTILAADSFDPRLMWDRARAHR